MTTSSRPPPSKSIFDVDVTIVSAKHLKNVNWRYGDLKPYAIVYLVTSDTDTSNETDSEKNLFFATKPDDAGSTCPVWNEKFVFPVPGDLLDWSALSIDIFHSKPSETPKPLVGTVRCSLKDLIRGGSGQKSIAPIRTLELRRPSGRPQGKLRVKISFQERIPPPSAPAPLLTWPPPDYNLRPPSNYYYSNTHPAPALRDYQTYSAPPPPPPAQLSCSNRSPSPPLPATTLYQYRNYTDPYSRYYSSCFDHYSAPPAPSTRVVSVPPPPSYYDRVSYGGPSAPAGYLAYDQGGRTARMGVGAGLAIGAVAGALGGIALEEGLKYEGNNFTERVESDNLAKDNHSEYRADY